MPMTRLSSEQEDRIIRSYEEWDPEEQSIDDLASSLGTTRQTIYNVLNRRGVKPKVLRRVDQGSAPLPPDLMDGMADRALSFLLGELVELRNKVRHREEVLREVIDLRTRRERRDAVKRALRDDDGSDG